MAKEEETIAEKPTAEEEIAPREGMVTDWHPKTSLGIKVNKGQVTDIEEVLNKGWNILEAPIVDFLVPGLQKDLLLIGQSKGKFGGGQRRVFRQTQKKTCEGNKPSFATYAVVGNANGLVGLGYGKSKETVPAREKALRNAKQGIFKIVRGCGSWQCNCHEPHSIPFAVTGKVGSCVVTLFPAPRGKGLVVEKECAKLLKLAGIQDVWSKTKGHTSTKMNVIKACEQALKQLIQTKVLSKDKEGLGMTEGVIKQ